MDIRYNDKQFIAVEYPGTVLNLDKMLKTLGGEKEMFSVFKDSTKRLELKFRPDDPYCKSARGDRFNTTNLLLKVLKRTRKRPKNEVSPTGEPDVQLKIEFIGAACTTYKFKALADFQVLPITYDIKKKGYKSLIPELLPSGLQPASWMDEETELFLPPVLFSRFDLPQNGYMHMQNSNKIPGAAYHLPPNIISSGRIRRSRFTIKVSFENPYSCDKPQSEAVAQLQTNPLELDVLKKLNVLFDKRPIWTRRALLSITKCESSILMYALPCAAYNFQNGPWRSLWVKFGYDPQKEKAAKVYQVLDLRITPNICINIKNKRRLPSYCIPNKNTQNQPRISTLDPSHLIPVNRNEEMVDNDITQLLSYEYFPGYLPTKRQCFFQLCDIHLDAVQKLVHKNDGQEGLCHEKDGWCEQGTVEKCREILLAEIIKTSKELKQSVI